MIHRALLILVFAAGMGHAAPGIAQYGMANDLPVRTYFSKSRQVSLRVDPSQRSGAGKANYVLRMGGVETWSGEHPFTFWDAVVDEDGAVAGYAYSNGINQHDGQFVVAILAPDGAVRMSQETPRAYSPYLHTLGDPKANGLFLDADDDRLVVRVDDPDLNEASESWWTWRVSDGQVIGKFKPRDHMADASKLRRVLDARPLAGTPLILVQWYRDGCWQQSCSNQYGSRFTLVDAETRPVWTLDFPTDYTNSADEEAQSRAFDDMHKHGAILDTSRAGRFDIRQVAARLRLSFSVEPDEASPAKWKVRKIATATYVEKGSEPIAPVAVESTDLRRLGQIELGAEQAEVASPIRNIREFAVGEAGRLAFTSGCGCDREEDHALIVVDSHGALVRKVVLADVPKVGNTTDHVAWIGANRWLVVSSGFQTGVPASAAWIDADSGKIDRVDGFVDAQIEALAASTDGSFVVLARQDERYTSKTSLSAFDSKGESRWVVEENNADERKMFSPEDVALTAIGEVVVVDNIRDKLQIYDPDGKWLRNLDLEELWGREPNYPSGIEADSNGGVIIHDFHGKPPIVRMLLDGSIVDTFTPRFANGGAFEIHGNVQSSPEGKLWTSDGNALLRLDAKGKVDKIIGRKPDTQSLGDIAALYVANSQDIYAVDARTGAVHVFDRMGLRKRVLEPAVGDYAGNLSDPSLAVMDDGGVYVARKGLGDERLDFLHYDGAGHRLGVVSLPLDGEVSQEWYAQPGGSNRLVVGYDNVYRVDTNNTILRRIERSADGQWLDKPSLASVASDGSFAVASGGAPAQSLGAGDSPRARVNLFSAQGDIVETWDAPEGFSFLSGAMAYDGQRFAFLVGAGGFEEATTVLITDKHGSHLLRFTPPAGHAPGRVFLVNSDARSELWLFDGKKRINRYAMPAE